MPTAHEPFAPGTQARRSALSSLAVINAVLLLVGLLALSTAPRSQADDGGASVAGAHASATTTTMASTTSTTAAPDPGPAPQATGAANTDTTRPAPVQSAPAPAPKTSPTTAAPRPAPVAAARDAVLDGRARSVAVEGSVPADDTVTLSGSVQIGVEGDVTDASGATYQGVLLEVRGSQVSVTGALSLVGDPVIVRPHDGALPAPNTTDDPDPFVSDFGVELGAGESRISGTDYRYRSADGWVAIPGPITIVPDTFSEPDVGVWGGNVRWDNPPASLQAEARRLSWAGGGTITVGSERFSHDYLGIDPPGRPAFTLTRTGGEVTVRGQARVHMVYVDGWPRLRTGASVTNHTPEVTVSPGGRTWLTWVPRNQGNDFDMTMTRFRPDTEAASWVNLALGRLPAMYGGEDQPRRGGDTAGFGSRGSGFPFGGGAHAIWPMIGPGKGDSKDLSLDVPSDTPLGDYRLAITIEGNFDPVTYETTVHVVADSGE